MVRSGSDSMSRSRCLNTKRVPCRGPDLPLAATSKENIARCQLWAKLSACTTAVVHRSSAQTPRCGIGGWHSCRYLEVVSNAAHPDADDEVHWINGSGRRTVRSPISCIPLPIRVRVVMQDNPWISGGAVGAAVSILIVCGPIVAALVAILHAYALIRTGDSLTS